jgi:putative ABC transport system permease protein
MSLTRPGNQARVVLLAVGLGSFFIIGVRSLETNLLRAIAVEVRAESPDLFLIDIQQDQATALGGFLKSSGTGPFRLIPVLRARVSGVRGREVNLDGYDDVRGRGSLGREYVITYRNNLEPNETLVEGTFWGTREARARQIGEVSIESSIKERFRINVGDLMRFDVLGRTIRARVTSIRHVDWDDARNGGFMFVFKPDSLAKAPHTYIGMVKGPADATERARLQRDLVGRFPNVTAIDGLEILRVVQDIVAKVSLGITVIGLVALLTGSLILAGAVAMTKFQRLYESAILKTLGATTRTIATMLVLEYSALGALAGVLGSAAALVLSWAMCRYLFEIRWSPTFDHVTGVVVTTLAAGSVGVLSSLDVLRRKPLATLRAE